MARRGLRRRLRRMIARWRSGKRPRWATSARLQQYLRDHGDVGGWFATPDMLIWDGFLEHQEATRVEGHLLEIGVHEGRSGFFSALFAGADEHCWFVDVDIRAEFRQTIEARMPGNAHCLECSSLEVGKSPESYFTGIGQFRWIHIDGQHTARAVVNDLQIADQLIAPRGVVCVDDFLSPTWPHVAAGVFRYLHEHPGRFELFLTAYNKGYLARPEAVDFYQAFVREGLPPHLRSRRFGNFTLVESNLLDADDGIHCLGIGKRFENTDRMVTEYRIG